MQDKPATISSPAKPRFRRLLRFAAVAVVGLAALAVWSNGPGLRWLGPKIAAHFAGRAGVETSFRIEGSYASGIVIRDIRVAMAEGPLRLLTIDSLTPLYQPSRLPRGEIQGVAASGIHAALVLEPGTDEPSEPLDFSALADTLHDTREMLLPYTIDVSDITADILTANGQSIALAPTAIRRASGENTTTLDLGAVSIDGETRLDAQEIPIDWQPDSINIPALVLHPRVRAEEIRILHDEGLAAEGLLVAGDATFQLTSFPGFESATLFLRDGRLDAADVADILGLDLPASATLTSLMLEADGLMPDPMRATATLGIMLEEIRYEDTRLDEITAELILNPDDARFVVRTASAGAEARLDTTTTLDRAALRPLETRGSLEIPAIAPWVDVFPQYLTLPENAAEIPEAAVTADFTLPWDESSAPAGAQASLAIRPADEDLATPIEITARWVPDSPLEATLTTDGLAASASLDLDASTYLGNATLASFDTRRIEAWLAVAAIEMPGVLSADAVWRGSGPFAADGHAGDLTLTQAVWTQLDQPGVTAAGRVAYQLPESLELDGITVSRDGQTIAADAALADGTLTLRGLLWTDADGTELADASGALPFPENPAEWRDTLANDTRPLDLTIQSRPLGFDRLATWVPALAAADPRATASLELRLAGSFATPELDSTFLVRDLRATDQPDLPPADIRITVAGRSGSLAVNGEITTPDYPPVTLTATLPFTPADWAADPDTLTNARVTAAVTLPRLELARFTAMAPGISDLAGTLTGGVDVAGTVGAPEITGRIDLASGRLRLDGDAFPEITGINANATFDLERAALRDLRATIAGGTLTAEAAYDIGPGTLDARIRGDHLPVVRDESIIIRANADVRVAGTLEQAAITGTVSIVDSLFFRDIEILPIGTPFTGPQAAALPKIDAGSPTQAIPEPFSNWPLDLRLTTAEPFLIRGNLATGRVDADVRVRGTLGNPAPDGRIRLTRGRASLPFSSLDIPEGIITFTPATGLDPTIELRGRADPRPYSINLFVYGRLSDPQIVLTSNPPLPENEIMTLLATGTTTRGLEDPRAASDRAIQLLAEEIRRGRVPFSNQLRPMLGLLDRVDFSLAESDPYSSDTFSTATLQLHDRWYLSAGMGDEGNTRMFAIWRLRFR